MRQQVIRMALRWFALVAVVALVNLMSIVHFDEFPHDLSVSIALALTLIIAQSSHATIGIVGVIIAGFAFNFAPFIAIQTEHTTFRVPFFVGQNIVLLGGLLALKLVRTAKILERYMREPTSVFAAAASVGLIWTTLSGDYLAGFGSAMVVLTSAPMLRWSFKSVVIASVWTLLAVMFVIQSHLMGQFLPATLFAIACSVFGLGLAGLKEQIQLNRLLPIMVALLILSFGISAFFLKFEHQRIEKRYLENVRAAESEIAARVRAIFDLLHGIAGLFAASKEVEVNEFKAFMESQIPERRLPGLFGTAYVRRVPQRELQAYEEQMRISDPEFKIKPARGGILNNSGDHFVTHFTHSEYPLAGIRGIDLASEPARLAALQYAIQNRRETLSDPIQVTNLPGDQWSALAIVPLSTDALIIAPIHFAALIGELQVIKELQIDLNLVLQNGEHSKLVYSSIRTNHSLSRIPALFSFFDPLRSTSDIRVAQQTFSFDWRVGPAFASSPMTLSASAFFGVVVCSLLVVWLFVAAWTREAATAKEVATKTAELTHKEKLWRAMTGFAPVGIYQTDREGSCTYVNPEWEKISGISLAAALGNGWTKALHPDDRPKLFETWQNFINGDAPFNYRYRFIHGDGTERWVHGSAAKIVDDLGVLVSVVGVNVDITEQIIQARQIEDDRLRAFTNAKMAALGQMAGGVAHEINNPLAIISAYASQMRATIDLNGSKEKLYQAIGKINETVMRIARIVSGMRTLSRGADGDPFVNFNLRTVVDETLELCVEKFKNADIKFTVLGDMEYQLNGRPGQIGQIILNLLNNAFDAVSGQDQKEIAIEVISLAGALMIRVMDNGPGVPEAVVNRIMEPFFTTKEVGKGTGLGLSISRKIAEAHGGSLQLDRSRTATCFVLVLPLAPTISTANLNDPGKAAA